jgi:hypothetical protein
VARVFRLGQTIGVGSGGGCVELRGRFLIEVFVGVYCPQFLRHGESWACYPLAVGEEGADGAQVRFTG